jgi:alpha-ketoglutarate-dependent taurine dioxygenase
MADASGSSGLETLDLTPRIGTEIRTDLESLLSGRFSKQMRSLLEQRGVLVIRDAPMSDDQLRAFGETLGELDALRGREFLNMSLDTGLNAEAEYVRASIYWHIDRVGTDRPHLAGILTPRRLSAVGGETEFANAYAAWDDLPEHEQQAYAGLRVVHALETSLLMVVPEPSLAQLESWRIEPAREQPLVWTHASGRKSLVIGATAMNVVGKSAQESNTLLTRLRDWATQPRYVYTHHWRMGDVVIWDNTGTLHRVRPYAADSGRLLRRISLRGEELLA